MCDKPLTRRQIEEESALGRLILYLVGTGVIPTDVDMKTYIQGMKKVAQEYRSSGLCAQYLYTIHAAVELLSRRHTHCIGYESIDKGDKFVFIINGKRYVTRKFVTRPKFVKAGFELFELEKSASTIADFHAELNGDRVASQQYIGGKKWKFCTLSESSFTIEFNEDRSFSIDD
jgi:hypothetical protein